MIVIEAQLWVSITTIYWILEIDGVAMLQYYNRETDVRFAIFVSAGRELS